MVGRSAKEFIVVVAIARTHDTSWWNLPQSQLKYWTALSNHIECSKHHQVSTSNRHLGILYQYTELITTAMDRNRIEQDQNHKINYIVVWNQATL